MALYQQGTQRIEIIVRKEGGGTDETAAKETSTDEMGDRESTWRTSVFGTENSKRIKRIIKTNTTHALAVTKQIVDLGVEFWISGLGQMNGDQALQDSISRKYEILKDTTNFASSVAMGALYGSWGGPIGAITGAALGAVSTGISTAVKYANRERDFNYKIFKEENGVEYLRARANINLTNGRLR